MFDWPMSSPQKTTMFCFLPPAAGFCCACAALMHSSASAAINGMSLPFMVMPPSLVERKDSLPVGFHADDDPVVRLGLVPGLVELADVRGAVVGELTLGVVVVHDEREALAGAVGGDLQHLQIAVGVAECGNRPAADLAVDADRLARAVVDEDEVRAAPQHGLTVLHLELHLLLAADDLLGGNAVGLLGPGPHELDRAARDDEGLEAICAQISE